MSERATHRDHQAMGPGAEFDTIRSLVQRWGDLAVDIGDDAAVLPPDEGRRRVVSTDACVEGAHFRRPWLRPFEIGVRAAAAAISDLAAMGAQADAVLFAIAVPETWLEALLEIGDGLAQVTRASGARIVGGNLSRSDCLSITTTVIGSADLVISRRGAQPGDLLVVTGTLGGPGTAVRAWEQGREPSAWARARFASPVPRLREGQALARAGASAMLDISDGLAADARHLAAASGVRLVIDAPSLPRPSEYSVGSALVSGEEYELLAAIPPRVIEALRASWPEHSDVPLTIIGRVADVDAAGRVEIVGADTADADGGDASARVEFATGYDHFTR